MAEKNTDILYEILINVFSKRCFDGVTKNIVFELLKDLDLEDILQIDDSLFIDALSENSTDKGKAKILASIILRNIHKEIQNYYENKKEQKVNNHPSLLDMSQKVSEYALFSEKRIIVMGLLSHLKKEYSTPELKNQVKQIKIEHGSLHEPDSIKVLLSLLEYFDKTEVLDIAWNNFGVECWDNLKEFLQQCNRKIYIVIFGNPMITLHDTSSLNTLQKEDFEKLIWIPSMKWVERGTWKYIFADGENFKHINTIVETHSKYFQGYEKIMHT